MRGDVIGPGQVSSAEVIDASEDITLVTQPGSDAYISGFAVGQ